jgi:hypothetical protein
MIPIIERKMIKPINDTYRTVTVRVVEPEAPRLNIVYFHRFGGESLEFLSPAQELASVGCRVSAMEYLGHTASEWLPKDDYAPTHDVQFARTLLAAQEGDLPLLIIANGWGCHVALQAMSAAAHAPVGAVLFDYVNAFNYNTDIVMPFDAAVARIVAESLPEFERELKRLAQPLGAYGVHMAELALKRAQDVGGLVSLRLDASAFAPFSTEPDRVFTSGHLLGDPPCEVIVVNGRLAQFKNLLRPPQAGVVLSEKLRLLPTAKIDYLRWRGKTTAELLITFLRDKGLLEDTML